MDVFQKLIRILQDDYKVGAEMHSGKPIIYIDPNKFDEWQLKKDNQTSATQIAKQLDAQYPGLSEQFSTQELEQLTKDSLKLGPFARTHETHTVNNFICVINESKGDQITVDQLYTTFGLTPRFNPAHLKKFPTSDARLAQLIGEHEGEHCNQDPIYSDDRANILKSLDGEIRSDRAALDTLRKEGNIEAIDAWKAFRAMVAANGDTEHATSIFLDDPEFKGVTKAHLTAARDFEREMSLGVAANLGISLSDARDLRLDDPQRYANIAEDALKKGQIPALRDISDYEASSLLMEKMGLPDESGKTITEILESQPVSKVNAAYQALRAEGALQDRGIPNPYINKYIQSYIDGTRVLFVKDTTPALKADTKSAEAPIKSSEAELAELDLEQLKNDAPYGAETVMNEIVKKSLGLTDEQVTQLSTLEPEKYYKAVEDGLKKGIVPLQTETRSPQDKIDGLVSKKLDISIPDISKQHFFLIALAEKELEKEGLINQKRDNPYLKDAIQDLIQTRRQEQLDKAVNAASNDEPAKISSSAENSKPVAAVAGKYSYLGTSPQDDGKGVPQIDLRSEDKGQMKIGCLSACEYFATKADPVLAAQTVQPVQGAELNDPTLKQKVASNATSYLNTSNGLA